MTTPEITGPAATAAPPGGVRFLGDRGAYWRLLIRGAGLLMVTLGIYRFWLTTDVRRFLWSNTEVAGESLEYTGTPFELLLGFLIAIAILIPVYAAFFVATLDLGAIGQFSGVLGFALLAVLGQYAVYRARRYRLTRTIYRGVRFHQGGSAWRYAVCAIFWWTLTLVTLGLAFPWKEARLERFKLRHTHYGDLAGRFEGSAFGLFIRGLPMWLLVFVPLAAAVTAIVQTFDWKAFADAAAQGGDDVLGRIEGANPGLAGAIVFAMLATGFAVFIAALLYPVFQALVLRWWASGLRFGELEFRSHLRTRQVYGAYMRFFWYSALFALAVSVIGGVFLLVFQFLFGTKEASATVEFVQVAAGIVGYVVVALGYSTIYRATVMLSLWRLGMESLELKGLAALDRVKATGTPSSALGEGLADALNVGGF